MQSVLAYAQALYGFLLLSWLWWLFAEVQRVVCHTELSLFRHAQPPEQDQAENRITTYPNENK